jgi:fatty acid synthase subunit beta
MVEIMFMGQWVHQSYKERFLDFVKRSEERFISQEVASVIDADCIKSDPTKFLGIFLQAYPSSSDQLLTAEDVDYFLYLCRER